MPQTSTAHAQWSEMSGSVSTDSDALDAQPLAWKARIGETAGTTPEELLAAGWASCYAMALTFELKGAGHDPKDVDVDATMSFGPEGDGFAISGATLTVRADVPGISDDDFMKIAEGAKVGCPVSKAFAGNIDLKLTAKLATAAH